MFRNFELSQRTSPEENPRLPPAQLGTVGEGMGGALPQNLESSICPMERGMAWMPRGLPALPWLPTQWAPGQVPRALLPAPGVTQRPTEHLPPGLGASEGAAWKQMLWPAPGSLQKMHEVLRTPR